LGESNKKKNITHLVILVIQKNIVIRLYNLMLGVYVLGFNILNFGCKFWVIFLWLICGFLCHFIKNESNES